MERTHLVHNASCKSIGYKNYDLLLFFFYKNIHSLCILMYTKSIQSGSKPRRPMPTPVEYKFM